MILRAAVTCILRGTAAVRDSSDVNCVVLEILHHFLRSASVLVPPFSDTSSGVKEWNSSPLEEQFPHLPHPPNDFVPDGGYWYWRSAGGIEFVTGVRTSIDQPFSHETRLELRANRPFVSLGQILNDVECNFTNILSNRCT